MKTYIVTFEKEITTTAFGDIVIKSDKELTLERILRNKTLLKKLEEIAEEIEYDYDSDDIDELSPVLSGVKEQSSSETHSDCFYFIDNKIISSDDYSSEEIEHLLKQKELSKPLPGQLKLL